jgi:hypothetical protein
MWEEIFKWLAEHSPIVMIMIILVVITFIVAKAYLEWGHRVTKVEAECSKIESIIIPRLNSMEASINSLASSFRSLIAHLSAKDPTINITLFIAKSPFELSPAGEQILNESGGKAWVDRNKEVLFINLDNSPIRSALDVQIEAPKTIAQWFAMDDFIPIKNYIYNNPQYKPTPDSPPNPTVPITLESVASIMGLYLRDLYLQIHPELRPSTTT